MSFTSNPTNVAVTTGLFNFSVGTPMSQSTGTAVGVSMSIGFFPTGGSPTDFTSLLINPTINQTGGASGVTRGLYINPVLTAVSNFRAIETLVNVGSGYQAYFGGSAPIFFQNGCNFEIQLSTGTKFGTSPSQKLAFWNATPIVQPTTAVASATYVAVGGGNIQLNDTFDGYTVAKVIKAIRNIGLIA
jgi:hypothetical protein